MLRAAPIFVLQFQIECGRRCFLEKEFTPHFPTLKYIKSLALR